jgi:glycosyltransferase involved in cell wall biosynthesis
MKEARPLRVGFLSTELGAGGAEKIIYELARRIPDNDFEVAGVWEVSDSRGFYARKMSEDGIALSSLGVKNILGLPRALSRLRSELEEANVDVLNAHLFHASLLGRRVCRGNGPALVVSHHFNETRNWRFAIERLVGGSPAAVTAVSGQVAVRVTAGLHLAPGTVQVVANGVESEQFARPDSQKVAGLRSELGCGDSGRIIGALGRLVKEKDPQNLLKAFALLAAEHQDAVLVFFGEGPLRSELEAAVGDLNLSDRVFLPGFVDDVSAALGAIDVYVTSSITEGHPLALLEAMAAGRPIVASDIVAHSQIANLPGSSGDTDPVFKTFKPGDCAAAAAAIGKCLNDSELSAELGRRAAALVSSRYGIERMVEEYRRVFRQAGSMH